MIQNLFSDKRNRGYLAVGLAWILVWAIPWGNLPLIQEGSVLPLLTDMIRLGVALLIFLFPGALLYILLRHQDESEFLLPGILPIGFTFSVFLIAVIGLA